MASALVMARARGRDGNRDAAASDSAGHRSACAQSATGGPVLTERRRGLNVVHDNGSIYGISVEKWHGQERHEIIIAVL